MHPAHSVHAAVFLGDAGNQRYLGSYFDMYPAGHGRQPGGGDGAAAMGGVWRHGDWLKVSPHGGCTIYGRSDATINRHGLRMGTSEIYSAVEALPEVLDSMVVDLEYLGRESFMPMFVVLRDGLQLDAALQAKLAAAIRQALSPRFVPDEIVQVAEIPPHPDGQKAGAAHQKAVAGPAFAEGGEPRHHGQPGQSGLVCRLCAAQASAGCIGAGMPALDRGCCAEPPSAAWAAQACGYT